jgi:hypothetical protein
MLPPQLTPDLIGLRIIVYDMFALMIMIVLLLIAVGLGLHDKHDIAGQAQTLVIVIGAIGFFLAWMRI